ncbi:BTAD domain-containing putative transcriptional regulator [Kutzneria buriramensis]|uniref:DNA-binding SARP family transcriptional activator n=1 Tax=Kutzneria buriramensis TaxID=1045776 RepID=A0A3E0HFA4_9PSEU|nr:BTAD domain-containing putative transcriptional regulator [Kutzneria buriramensis]REH43877.1 DNA-binding SARP family transcriptional activator [Kutzneria buriramensis]
MAAAQVRVLGPLEVETGGRTVELSWPRLRVLVALLVANAGRVVSVAALVESLWGQRVSPDAHRTVRTYISRLRQALPAKDLILTRSPGYLIQLAPDAIDAVRFERAAADGRKALADGHFHTAAEGLRAALAVWRDDAYGEFAEITALRIEGDRLNRLRLSVVEDRIDADLGTGTGGELIPELEGLIVLHPGRERLWGQLMRALYRAGRQSDALAAFRRAREALVEEAGVEPSPVLTAIHQRILAHDPTLLPTTGVRPAQLPPAARGFTGRATEIAALDAHLAEPAAVVIAGSAGVGKTALALHWAHRVAEQFPDGQLYLNLRGFDPHLPPVATAEAIRVLLDAFSLPPERIPATVDAQVSLYRSLVAGKRALIVIDDAATSQQVRPLLPGSGCATVITSRDRLTGLVTADGALPLVLDRIDADQAQELLIARLGRDRVAAEPDAVDAIVASCAGLPLALAVVAARLAGQPRYPLAAVAADLQSERLDALDTGDPATRIRALFAVSYQRLEPDAARLFRLLGLHPGPHVTPAAAASLAAVPPARVRVLLAELARAHLVEDLLPGQYVMHDLLRMYAEELTHQQDDRVAATGRMLDHYLHGARAAVAVLDPAVTLPTLAPPPESVVAPSFDDLRSAMAWLGAEHPVLVALVHLSGADEYAVGLASTVANFLTFQGYGHHQSVVQHAALAAAQRLGDTVAQARAHRVLGVVQFLESRFDDALAHHGEALDLLGPSGNPVERADIHHSIAFALNQTGRLWEALDHAERALDLYRAAGHPRQAQELGFVGVCHAMLGDNDKAIDCAHRSLALHGTITDPYGTAAALWCLGHARHNLGHYPESIAAYRELVAVHGKYGNRQYLAESLMRLGDVHDEAGEAEHADEMWQQAFEIFTDLGHANAHKVKARLAGAHRLPPLPVVIG